MLLIKTLIEERTHEHERGELIPSIVPRVQGYWRVTLADAKGAHFSIGLDADGLMDAVGKAVLAAQWRKFEVRAILWAAPVDD